MSVTWPAPVTTITLFVEDLVETKAFYERAFGLSTVFDDDASAVFRIGELQVNLLRATSAPELVEPAPVGDRGAGARFVLTVTVDDVDAVYAELQRRGVQFLNGPVDRPWGVRTAAFADPAGHVWEIAS